MAVLRGRALTHEQPEPPQAGALLTTTLCFSTGNITEFSRVEWTKHESTEGFMLPTGDGKMAAGGFSFCMLDFEKRNLSSCHRRLQRNF